MRVSTTTIVSAALFLCAARMLVNGLLNFDQLQRLAERNDSSRTVAAQPQYPAPPIKVSAVPLPPTVWLAQLAHYGYFCPNPQKGKIHDSIRTNRATTLISLSVCRYETEPFQRSFCNGVPLPDGVCFAFPVFCETLIAQNPMGAGMLIFGLSGPRHSTIPHDPHRGGARCVQNGSALVPKSSLSQLEAVHFFPTGRDFYLSEGLGKNNLDPTPRTVELGLATEWISLCWKAGRADRPQSPITKFFEV